MIRAASILACLLLAACGQKGALYLPDEGRPVVVPSTAAGAAAGANTSEGAGDTSDDETRRRQADPASPAR